MTSADDCWTDHRLIRSTMAIKEGNQEFPDNIEEHWTKLKTSIIAACEQTIGYQTKKHQDWFDENDSEIERMIDKKRKAFQIWQRDRNCATKKKTYANAKAEVQRRTRKLKNTW
ncbi:Hypothetical predicted protein [Podarcis lilfordi]|uniref:Endonuclease/exonuclease/phosphatase domain-containing protein n=1 Tax=Podarcis lilfordi TaxID=74358 RepID=A0AA35P377_9SAUR|nr:Hypothetical predicted protein [Podarcis lilfordi]